jgi:hypothetical protein
MLLKGVLNNFNTDRQQQLYSNSLSTFFLRGSNYIHSHLFERNN